MHPGSESINMHDEGLKRMIDLDVTWGFYLPTVMRERCKETPAAVDAGDGTVETMESFKRNTMDASSVPAGTAESNVFYSLLAQVVT